MNTKHNTTLEEISKVTSQRFVVLFFDEAKERGWPTACEDCWCIYDTKRLEAGLPRIVGSDGGEPEDQLLVRDWDWVVKELNILADEKTQLYDLIREAADSIHASTAEDGITSERKKYRAQLEARLRVALKV